MNAAVEAARDAVHPLVSVRDLRVRFGAFEAVRGVSFDVSRGECFALVGESGSGKSVTARALLGLSGDGASISAASLQLGGVELPRGTTGAAVWRQVRGGRVGLVHQDALVALDPLRPVWREVEDALRLHTELRRVERRERAFELLERVGLEDARRLGRRRSGQLSGGQRQRALVAAALAGDPELLIADEPTSSVDQAVQAQLVELFRSLADEGMTVLFITHDLGVVQRLADRVAVMSQGQVVETAVTAELFAGPRHQVTRELLAAQPRRVDPRETVSATAGSSAGCESVGQPPEQSLQVPVLDVHAVSKRFRGRDGARTRAVHGASFSLRRGETLGIVGASGSGKSTLARLALGLEAPEDGWVEFLGRPWNPAPERLRRPHRPKLGFVPQDALSSFDPRRTVGEILADAVSSGRTSSVRGLRGEIDAALRRVGLDADVAGQRPLHLSGGQRQRVAIARALSGRPEVLLCDEPVSSLDVTVQAQVLALLQRLVSELGLACVFISHDLAVVEQLSDRVAVMHAGEIVETAAVADLFARPSHEATQALLDAHRRLEVRSSEAKISPRRERLGDMSITKAQLTTDRDAAMKAKFAAPTAAEKAAADARLSLLRQLLGAIGEAETAGRSRQDLSPDDLTALFKRERSKRLETVRILTEAAEPERAAAEQAEADIIEEYLPTSATEEELREFLIGFVAARGSAMPSGGAAIGVAMQALKGRFPDFDARVASALVRELTNRS